MKKGLILFIAVMLIFSLIGCNKVSENVGTFDEFNPEIKQGGTVEGYMLRPDTLNPLLTTIEINRKMLSLCFDSLFYLDSSYQIVPYLAENMVYSKGATALTLTLREGVKWHDGEDFDAYDVRYTINSILQNSSSPYYSLVSGLIDNASIIDTHTILLNLVQPNSGAHSLLTFPIIKNGSMKSEAFEPIGTGAFIYHELENAENFTFRKNKSWKLGYVYIDGINVNVLPDKESVFSAFNSGMIDFVHISKEDAGKFNINDSVKYSPVYTENYSFIGINCNDSILSRPVIRKALDTFLDKKTLAESAFTGYSLPTDLPVQPKAHFYPAIEKPDMTAFLEANPSLEKREGRLYYIDDESAEELDFTLLVNEDNSYRCHLADTVANMLGSCGINIRVIKTDFETYMSRIESGEFDLYIGSSRLTPDVNLYSLLGINGNLNYGGFSDDNVTALLHAVSECDSSSERSEKISALLDKFRNDIPHIPLCFENEMIVYNSNKIDNATDITSDNISAFIIRCSVKQ